MPSTIEAEETIWIGHETLVASKSPITEYGVFFEDDGETGYFYGLDTSRKEGKQILDALHIYNVRSVIDREKPSRMQIAWSEDGLKAALYINGYAHAVFDFADKVVILDQIFRARIRNGQPSGRSGPIPCLNRSNDAGSRTSTCNGFD